MFEFILVIVGECFAFRWVDCGGVCRVAHCIWFLLWVYFVDSGLGLVRVEFVFSFMLRLYISSLEFLFADFGV